MTVSRRGRAFVFHACFFMFCFGSLTRLFAADSTSWLGFLPKAERSRAVSLISAADAARTSLIADRIAAADAEEAYANIARILAQDLDAYGTSPEGLSLALSIAGQGPLSAEAAVKALADNRRSRWERARDIVEKRYGHATKKGFQVASSLEDEIARNGRALADILSKRLAKVPKKTLRTLATELENRIAEHPDCPTAAFASLRATAAALDGSAFNDWILSLTIGLPGALVSGEPYGEGSSQAEAAHFLAKDNFSAVYAARMSLGEAVSAAAVGTWYLDSIASNSDVAFVPVSQKAMASLSSFLRNLASADALLVADYLREDIAFREAFSEICPLVWIAFSRSRDRFLSDVGLDASVVEDALTHAWRATRRDESPSTLPVVDLAAVHKVEAFAALVEAGQDAESIFSAFADIRRDQSAFAALRGSDRYGSIRDRVNVLFDERLNRATERAEVEARSSSLAAALNRSSATNGAESLSFRLVRRGNDVFDGIVVAALFDRILGDGTSFQVVVPPSRIASSFAEFTPLIETGILLVTLPCCVDLSVASGAELWLLGSGKFFLGGPDAASAVTAHLAELSRLASSRIGVPADFVVCPGSGDLDTRQYAVFSANAARYALFVPAAKGAR